MKHTLTYHRQLSDPIKIEYRAVIHETLDEAEVPTLKPFARVY